MSTALVTIGVALALTAGACGASAEPLYEPQIQASIARGNMRRLETKHVTLYYPARRREGAIRFAEHLERCTDGLVSGKLRGTALRDRFVVVLPDIPLHNAYVQPGMFGTPKHMVVPTEFLFDDLATMGIPADPGLVSCHEAVHYLQAQQIRGVFRALNMVLGETFNPQNGIDDWFWEGLATYYESRLNPGLGRMASPFFRQTFASGVARDRIGGGTLSELNRAIPMGAQYLIGAHFVEYLAVRYGEDKLWRIVDSQAGSIVPVFNVNGRFRSVYGKSLSALIDDFAADVAATYPARPRPDGQRVVRTAGHAARYVRSRSGREALFWSDLARTSRITVWSEDGKKLLERKLPDVAPPRTITVGNVGMFSGASFSADGRYLYFTAWDPLSDDLATRLLRLDVQDDDLSVVHANLGGSGGSLSPDDARYVFPRGNGDQTQLAEVDVRTGDLRILHEEPPGTTVLSPRVSPDGKRIAAMRSQGNRFAVWLYDAATGAPLEPIAQDASSVYDPAWIDDDRVVALREIDGRLQAVVYELATGETRAVTALPYAARYPMPAGDTLRFLNREGWGWTVDEVSLLAAAPPAQTRVPGAEKVNAAGFDGDKPTATAARLEIRSDRPYSGFDHLFVPDLRVPFYSRGSNDSHAGVELAGGDRLGFHRWGLKLDVGWDANETRFGGGLSYLNSHLAPWFVGVAGSQRFIREDVDMAMPTAPPTFLRERTASVSMQRSFSDNPVSLSLAGIEQTRHGEAGTEPTRLVGPSLAAEYAAGRGTEYGGVNEAIVASAAGAVYPVALGSDFTLGDVGGQLGAVVPLPFTARHSLLLVTRGRALMGAPGEARLLQVGGQSDLIAMYASRVRPAGEASDVLPTGVSLSEPLRGYEDLSFATNRAALVDAGYRLTLAIDRGTASTLWFLPRTFVQELELELFGSGAVTGDGARHAAAGTAATLLLSIWKIPLAVRYQFSHRLVDDEANLHLVGLVFAP